MALGRLGHRPSCFACAPSLGIFFHSFAFAISSAGMAVFWHVDPGFLAGSIISRSFVEALYGSSFSSTFPNLKPSSFHGFTALLVSEEFFALAEPFKFSLVDFFPSKRPSLASIRKFFVNLKLNGDVSVTLLDQSHVLIKFDNDLDYSRVFCDRSYLVFNCFMRLMKWSPTEEIGAESPIVPIWISFPNLCHHFYSTRILHGLGLLFGRPLKVDNATAVGLRPSVARVLVEIDVTKKFVDKIWLGPEKLGYFQQVMLEDLPLYCAKCKRLGHSSDSCRPMGNAVAAVPAKVVGGTVESDIQLGGVLAHQALVVNADSCEGGKVEATMNMPEEGMANKVNPNTLPSSGLLEEELGEPIDGDQLGNGCDVGSAIEVVPSDCSDLPVAGGLDQCEINEDGVAAPEGIIAPGIMITSPLSEGDEPLSKSIADPVFTVPITLVPREALQYHHSRDSEVLHAERILVDTSPDDESFYEEDLDS
ncbi:hypothetical protein M5K25_007198 [Dendrobium thyrsiflorum]|uniref:DUF4283 domain-containing protein n=1 Tax=Dendrobium thyrsiflorum TaxID=117978 RepID=A0ABD0VEL8_DENTH